MYNRYKDLVSNSGQFIAKSHYNPVPSSVAFFEANGPKKTQFWPMKPKGKSLVEALEDFHFSDTK